MNPKPRVLFLQPVLPSYRVPVFAGLVQRGFDVTCWSDHAPSGSVKHHDAAGAFATAHRKESVVGPFFSQPALLEAAQSRHFDVVVLPWNVRYLQLLPAVLVARARGLPVVLWGHARSKQERALVRRVRNEVGKLATACMTYDHAASEQLVSEGLERQRVFTAQNAIDHQASLVAAKYWQDHPEELAQFRAQHQLAGPTALFVSRLDPAKRVDVLLNGFRRVVDALPTARLAVVGAGPERTALEALTESLGLQQHVRFVGAVYEERELAAWFLSASVLAYPTHLGLSLLHAFAYGLPVLTSNRASDHGPEFLALRDGHNGLTYAAGDVEDFAAQLLRCLSDDALRSGLAAAAYASVHNPGGFNLSTMLEGMEAALRFAARTAARR